ALSQRAERHDRLAGRVYAARSARERLQLRAEQVGAAAERLQRRVAEAEHELAELAGRQEHDPGTPADGTQERVAALQAELAEIEQRRGEQMQDELAGLEQELEAQRAELERAELALEQARIAREHADAAAATAREQLAESERARESARREAARVGSELAAANQFLRNHHVAAGRDGSATRPARALSEELRIEDGCELALAAALGGRLDAAVVEDVAGAEQVLDRAGPEGGSALLTGLHAPDGPANAILGDPPAPPVPPAPPAPGARRLIDLISGPPGVVELAARLLAGAWVVESLDALPADFEGIAATRSGRVWFAGWGEVRQLSAGGSELLLARRNERDRLVAEVERVAQAEHAAARAGEQALAVLAGAERGRTEADDGLRGAERGRAEAAEAVRRGEWLLQQRRAAPAEGPLAVRRAELEGELAAERRQAEQRERELAARRLRTERLRIQREADLAAAPRAEGLAQAIELAGEAVAAFASGVEQELAADRRAGEEMAGRLRECAAEEAGIQGELRAAGETVTQAEVAAQRLRDQAEEAQEECATVAERLGFEVPQAAEMPEPLSEEQAAELQGRVERLKRRREQLGPVNPLAQDEYKEALEYVEELETQRADLETALRELRGVIRDTDRQIQETFEQTFQAAARNFEELASDVFPGGSGRLRLVEDEPTPRPVLGGQAIAASGEGEEAIEAAAEAEADAEERSREQERLPGVEIEITPAGKSSKRLTLLSGGEKSMTALAFLFAVFLARPCPFYILDEVEAALDDLNLDRFLALLRRYANRAQFIVITHQKRTMEAADWLFGVSMGGDGVSKVLSRRLPPGQDGPQAAAQAGQDLHVAEVA
ncbi:MAG: coiled-coil domain-containing protein, partial [Solirubrobacteraceae bacterium]